MTNSCRSTRFPPLLVLLWSAILLVLSAAQPPANDACSEAIDLANYVDRDDNLVEGSTVESTDDDPNLCGGTGASKRGIWYLYQNNSIPVGRTTIVTVSTCTDKTDFDTALTLYDGFCTGLNCVNGADNDSECGTGEGEHTTISWHAESGTRYYLLVHGSHVNHTGNFGLTVTTEEALETLAPGQYANQGDSSSTKMPHYGWILWTTITLLGSLLVFL